MGDHWPFFCLCPCCRSLLTCCITQRFCPAPCEWPGVSGVFFVDYLTALSVSSEGLCLMFWLPGWWVACLFWYVARPCRVPSFIARAASHFHLLFSHFVTFFQYILLAWSKNAIILPLCSLDLAAHSSWFAKLGMSQMFSKVALCPFALVQVVVLLLLQCRQPQRFCNCFLDMCALQT